MTNNIFYSFPPQRTEQDLFAMVNHANERFSAFNSKIETGKIVIIIGTITTIATAIFCSLKISSAIIMSCLAILTVLDALASADKRALKTFEAIIKSTAKKTAPQQGIEINPVIEVNHSMGKKGPLLYTVDLKNRQCFPFINAEQKEIV
jgi:CheY-specific phosphatase CheX